jgi:peptide/nickel transport system permease protein
LLILLAAYIGAGNVGIIIGIFGFLGWSGIARLIRSYYLTLRAQEFTEAARAVGVSSPRIIFRHILPNALSPVIVSFTLSVAAFISGEAAVDFLGVGIHTPSVSWGLALAGAQGELIVGNWWWAFFPGVCLLLMVLAVNFLGDGLRDALDVRAKALLS